jgi:hypothetical protein
MLITCFVDGSTSKMKSQSIAYLLNRSEHVYWIWNLESEVHSIWDLWVGGLQECKGNFLFSKSGGADREHGLHLDNEGGVPGVRPNPGQM